MREHRSDSKEDNGTSLLGPEGRLKAPIGLELVTLLVDADGARGDQQVEFQGHAVGSDSVLVAYLDSSQARPDTELLGTRIKVSFNLAHLCQHHFALSEVDVKTLTAIPNAMGTLKCC